MQANSPISIAIIFSVLLLVLQGCAGNGPRLEQAAAVEQSRVDGLELAILSLGAGVDPEEARRAARVAIDYSHQQAKAYDVSGSPIFHNVLVNLGLRDRGLCVDWTHDLMVRLRQERLRSLDLHWAVANYDATFRIEHSTVVISARGDDMLQGLVLDGWRNAGELYWAPASADPGYPWRPFAEVQAQKERRAELRLENRVAR